MRDEATAHREGLRLSGIGARLQDEAQGRIADLCWPLARLGEGLNELARRSGLKPVSGEPLVAPASVLRGDAADLDHWIGWAAGRLAIDIGPIETMLPQVDDVLLRAGPCVLRVTTADGPQFLMLLASRFGTPRLLAPDLRVRSCALSTLHAAICAEHEAPLAPAIDKLLDVAHVAQRRRDQVRAAITRERLSSQRIGGCWMLRLAPTSDFKAQLVRENMPGRLVMLMALFAAVYALEIFGWSIIGEAALNGRLDLGWLTAWILLVLSIIPLRLLGTWIDSTLAVDVGALLKLRLLMGALRLDIEAVKHQGVGQLLGRVMECQALESLAVNGGLTAIVVLLEFGFAAWILASGAGGWLHLGLLLGWLGITFVLARLYFLRLNDWTMKRLDMTHDLIEQMVGHRTRLAQEWSSRRDLQEDQSTKDYVSASIGMDRAILPFLAGIPSGWMVVGLIGLMPSFVAGTGTPASVAIGLGGVLLASRAFSGLSSGLAAVARASIAWRQAAPLFRAGSAMPAKVPFVAAGSAARAESGTQARHLIDADGITFRYGAGSEPILERAALAIAHGDRILFEGPSGAGKSTLASLLVGLRKPEKGLLLLNGLDRHTLGDIWHDLATEAPQFHENHVFTATLGFNLLMGRNWPASDDELAEATQLCRDLGLGDLLARMPSGMMQTVGETGWQLSHGERSRIFLARALLQNAELTILDESFAALDPETLKICLDCALARAKTLVVIAHP